MPTQTKSQKDCYDAGRFGPYLLIPSFQERTCKDFFNMLTIFIYNVGTQKLHWMSKYLNISTVSRGHRPCLFLNYCL